MILTGNEIYKEVKNGKIIIEPFDLSCIEPNSYGFHLGNKILEYKYQDYLEPLNKISYSEYEIDPENGKILYPGHFYLGSTKEKMGSNYYAKTLHATCSTALSGMWIQFSAPLGHIGAVINWTLEIQVAEPIVVYPGMKIGKLAFWKTYGIVNCYNGRYINSEEPVATKISMDFKEKHK